MNAINSVINILGWWKIVKIGVKQAIDEHLLYDAGNVTLMLAHYLNFNNASLRTHLLEHFYELKIVSYSTASKEVMN